LSEAPGEDHPNIRLRQPKVEDAAAIWRLVNETGVLDRNSSYTYLLFCRDFAETSIVAERDGEVVGMITGYRPPKESDVIFVWQVGVSEKARGAGLASAMLDAIVLSEACKHVRFLETTVTASNQPSRAMFASLAKRLNAEMQESAGFPAELFPREGGHEAEPRLRIGPFDPETLRRAQ
jgi:L-2,4-diaminobutyric acid acetyltransferase